MSSRVLICYGTKTIAKSPGLCPRCGTRWSEGDLIWCDSALALPKWQHAVCPDPLTNTNPEGACER